MKLSWLLKLLRHNQGSSNKGFTLTELLVAAAISVVVIGGAGYALMESQKSSRAATTQVDARTETNRALVFITDEIKGARKINDTRTGYALEPTREANLPTNFNPTGNNIRVVLALDVPNPSNPDANLSVIYYVKDSEAPWIGPRVIYRWGPNFDAKGGYSADTIGDSTKWQHEALIDRIPDSNSYLGTNSCLSIDVTVQASDAGFGACIDSTGRSASILISRIDDQRDWNSANTDTKNKSVFSTNLKAFARGDSKNTGFTESMELTTTTASSYSTSTQPAKTIRIQHLGSSYACTSTGGAVVNTEVTVTPLSGTPTVYTWKSEGGGYALKNGDSTNAKYKDIPYETGDTFTYTSKYVPTNSQCSMNSNATVSVPSTDTSKVEQLTDGKVLSSSDPEDKRMMENKYVEGNPSPSQQTVTEILQNQDSTLVSYDSATKTITIPQQVDGRNYTRVIYAFEMGPGSGTTGFHEAGFDYQDNLILVSIAGENPALP
jgi:prepilin-type N-terminal cleavage/methylation domain-containing protein